MVSSLCPNCGHCLPSDQPPQTSSNPNNLSLTQQAHHLEQLIAQLTNTRITILQKLNSSRATTSHLPPEILTNIFETACPPIDFTLRPFLSGELDAESHHQQRESSDNEERRKDNNDDSSRYFPLIIGAVSSHWRRIAWSTPSLWTTMAIDIWPGTVQIRGAMSLLHLYMQNAGVYPVSVELDFRKQQKISSSRRNSHLIPISLDNTTGTTTPSSHLTEIPLEPIRELIFLKNAQKIKTLRLSAPPPEWLYHLSTEHFSKLEDLSVGWPLPSPIQVRQDISLETVTTLRKLTIHHMVSNLRVQLHWPTLTILNLFNVRYNTCIELLFRSPNLVSYHSFSPLYSNVTPEDHLVPWFSNSPEAEGGTGGGVTLSHLEDFGWTCQRHNRWDDALFQHLNLPSLKKLYLGGLGTDSDMTLEMSFLSRLPKTLESIEFDALYHIPPETPWHVFGNVLRCVPQITTLALSNSCTGLLISILSSLTPSLDVGNGNGGDEDEDEGVVLPNLQLLKCRSLISYCRLFDSETCDFDGGEMFKRMLEGRMNRGLKKSFRLEMTDGCEMDWDVEVREELAEMVRRSGLQLEILEDSKLVDWL